MKHKLILKKNIIKIKGNLLENINSDKNFYNNEFSSLETNHNRIMYNLDNQYEKKERVIIIILINIILFVMIVKRIIIWIVHIYSLEYV